MDTGEKRINEFRHQLNNALVDWIPVCGSSLVVEWHKQTRHLVILLDCPSIQFKAIYVIQKPIFDYNMMARVVARELQKLYLGIDPNAV